MVRFLFTLFICSGVLTGNIYAATIPSKKTETPSPLPGSRPLQSILRLSVQDIEKLSGKKMSFKDKVRFGIAKLSHKLLPGFEDGVPTAKQIKQGRLSLIFGLSGVFLFLMGFILPAIVFLSLPLGIAALVLGIKSARGNGNTQAVIGIISGAALIFIWLLLAIIIAVFISTGGFWG